MGSWILSGIDAGAYAKLLMQHACEAAKGIAPGKAAPAEILVRAHAKTHLQVRRMHLASSHALQEALAEQSLCVQGSSTALVLMLDGKFLHAANVGDSGFMVVRGGQAVFKSPPQQRR